jgi:hypothetical protein
MAYVKDEAALEMGVRFMRALKLHPSDILHDTYYGDYVNYEPAQLGQTMTFNRDDIELILKIIRYYIDKATIYGRDDLNTAYKQKFQNDEDLKMKEEVKWHWRDYDAQNPIR